VVTPPPGSVAGQLNIKLDRMLLVNARPAAAVGTLSVTNLNLSWPQSVSLGDYQLKLRTAADGIRGNLLDTSGPLMLQGSVHLAPDGHYHLSGTLAPRGPGKLGTQQPVALPAEQCGWKASLRLQWQVVRG